jgi:hypothetical protein
MRFTLRKALAAFAVSGLLLSSCTPELLYDKNIPNFTAPADKALCVVIRQSSFGGKYAPLWLDAKLVSGTSGATITSFEVPPGPHLVITKINIKTKTKLNFQAGKIYYLQQAVWPVPFVGLMTGLTQMPQSEAAPLIEKERGSIRYSRINPDNGDKDLSNEDFQDETKDYDKWAQKEPAKAKAEADYPGY